MSSSARCRSSAGRSTTRCTCRDYSSSSTAGNVSNIASSVVVRGRHLRRRPHVLLLALLVSLVTHVHAEQMAEPGTAHLGRHGPLAVHPYMKGAADEGGPLWLSYRKSRAECYRLSRPRLHDTVVTMLLPHKSNKTMKAIHGGGLANLLLHTPADVVFFHTSWSEADLQRLRGEVSFEFEALCIANADWQDNIEAQDWEWVLQTYHGLGYRSMCRWYSRRVFHVLHRMGYRWMIRVDDDSDIPRPIPYNLTAAMQRRGAQYGFRGDDVDSGGTVLGLADAVRFWVETMRLDPRRGFIYDACEPQDLRGWNLRIVYNNFFMTDLSWWAQPRVQCMLRFLEGLNGHHKFRWGDAPLHTLVVGTMMDRRHVLQFDFDYGHLPRTFTRNDLNASVFQVPRCCEQEGAGLAA